VQRQQALQFNVPNGKLWKFHMRLWLFRISWRSDQTVYACNATSVGVVFA
jgi:hypothetical protein